MMHILQNPSTLYYLSYVRRYMSMTLQLETLSSHWLSWWKKRATTHGVPWVVAKPLCSQCVLSRKFLLFLKKAQDFFILDLKSLILHFFIPRQLPHPGKAVAVNAVGNAF